MTTAYTSLLGLALPVTGELSGTWGDTVNNSITSLLDSAIAGTTTLSSDVDVTLTTTTGAANTSRQAILLWTAGGTATRNITAPAQSKIYTVINASSSTQSIVLRGVGPTTGVTIVKGESAVCAWNGSDFIKISNTGGAAVFTTLDVTNLEVTNIKALDGTSAASIANSTGVISLTANPILSGGTANGVAYLNGSKVLTTGSALTFDGTNLGVGVTPSAWSPKAIQVGSWGGIQDMGGVANQIAFRGNQYYNSGDKFLNASGYANTIILDATNGIVFYTSTLASTSAGSSASMSQRMTLNTSGLLSIGSNTPYDSNAVLTLEKSNIVSAVINSTTNSVTLVNVANGSSSIAYTGTASNHPFALFSNAQSRLYIDTVGNVGIGTSSPSTGKFSDASYALLVQSASTSLGTNIFSSNSDNSKFIGLWSGHSSATSSIGVKSGTALAFGAWSAITGVGGFSTWAQFDANGTFSISQANNASCAVFTNSNASLSGFGNSGLLIQFAQNTTNNSYSPFSVYNSGAAAYKFRMADSGAIATAGSISLGTVTPATSGIGVQFPATQSASTDANTLDDYEEGTWTPTLTTSIVAATGITYAYREAFYTKIGNIVRASFGVKLNGLSTNGTGEITVTGFPFTQYATAAWAEATGSIKTAFFTTTTPITNGLTLYMVSNGTNVNFRYGNTDTALPASELTSLTAIDVVIVYQV